MGRGEQFPFSSCFPLCCGLCRRLFKRKEGERGGEEWEGKGEGEVSGETDGGEGVEECGGEVSGESEAEEVMVCYGEEDREEIPDSQSIGEPWDWDEAQETESQEMSQEQEVEEMRAVMEIVSPSLLVSRLSQLDVLSMILPAHRPPLSLRILSPATLWRWRAG